MKIISALIASASLVTILSLSTAAPAGAAMQQPFSVKKIGSGPPMILVPGLMSPGEVWSATVDRFKDRYECHVLTLAGFAGEAPARDSAASLTLDAPLLDGVRVAVIAYIKAQHLKRPIIVGHSLGGFLALWIAATAPDADTVGAVVSVDGVPFLSALMNPSATVESVKGQAAQMRQLYATLTPQQLRAQSTLAMGRMMKSPADIERAAGWAQASDPKTVGEAVYEMMVTDLRDRVASIRVPVLLLGAAEFAKDEASLAQVKASYEAQVAGVPAHTVTLVPEARHFIMLDAPQALWTAMDSFLSSLSSATR